MRPALVPTVCSSWVPSDERVNKGSGMSCISLLISSKDNNYIIYRVFFFYIGTPGHCSKIFISQLMSSFEPSLCLEMNPLQRCASRNNGPFVLFTLQGLMLFVVK